MSLLVAIAACVVLVWGAVYFRRGSLLDGCLALLVVGYCCGHYFLQFQIGPFPLTLDRLLLGVLCLGFLVRLKLGQIDAKPAGGADWLLMILLVLLFGSAMLAGGGRLDLEEGGPIWRLVAAYLMPVAMYWLARQSHLNKRNVKRVFAVLIALGLYLSVTAILEVTGQWWAVFPRHIADSSLGTHFGRARGPQLAAYSLGLYLAVSFAAAWLARPWLKTPWQIVLIATYPLFAVALYFTYTRSAWLAAAGALAVVLAVRLRGAWRPLALTGAVAIALFVVGAQWDRILGFQRENTASATRHSVYQRASFTYVSWRMFQDRPLLGCGLGRFYDAKMPYLADRSQNFELESIRGLQHHNTFLCLLTETGMVGLAVFLAVFVAWAQNAWLLCRSPHAPDWVRSFGALTLAVMIAYSASAMFHDVSLSPADQTLLFFVAGISVGLRREALATAPAAETEKSSAIVPPTIAGALS